MPTFDFSTMKFINTPFQLVQPNPLSFDDSARQSGLYILGKPRMGKSWFMVNLMIEDRHNSHGIFFIDPHGDAIDKLLENLSYLDLQNTILLNPTDLQNTILLDPEDPYYSFGINLLECNNRADIKARNDTFNRAKGVFDKLWKDTFEDKPWLQLILQNTIYAFIENPGYTLAEFPYFYRDSRFREAIVSNMRYNNIVKKYWLDFCFRSKRLQEDQLEAAHTRIETMLGHEYVTDIVGQSKTTINFNQVLARGSILLVKLSTHSSDESKRIIGTVLVSELLHAIQHRTTRDQFCIYIDEFQNFAGFQDFPTLITQAPKFGIATTLAHHERYGQLANNPQIVGATAAIANKVLFQITPRDAHELAPEFADEPPKEIKREDQFIVSRAPIWDLLKWHDSPQVREYVNKYIRPMKERLEDIMGEAEAERLLRTEYLDEANIYRLDERIEAVDRMEADYGRQRRALGAAERLTEAAREQTRRLRSLNEEVAGLRLTFRALNKLFTAIMENAINPDSWEFMDYVVTGITGMADLTYIERKSLEFYLSTKGRSWYMMQIPFDIAKAYDLMPERVKEKEEEAEKQRHEMVEWYVGRSWQQYKEKCEEARRKVRPKDISGNIQDWEMNEAVSEVLRRNPSLFKKLEEFMVFCKLLTMPENRIKVKSGQYTEREVNARTEQDMIGERARELMALPKYTVYIKKLDSSHAIKVYKTATKMLPDVTVDVSDDIRKMIENTRKTVCRLRRDIQNEIYNRQMPVIEESGPPSPYD